MDYYWTPSENSPDEYEHHECSRCGELANYHYIVEERFEFDWDENLTCAGVENVGIKEFLTPYCPYCGAEIKNKE